MRGIKTNFKQFGTQFLEQLLQDLTQFVLESGIGKRGDIRLSTISKVLDKELDKRSKEEEE